MHLNVGLQQRLSQQLKLAPRMIQSMEILQLPLVELQERIEQELSENVVLERATAEGASADGGDGAGGADTSDGSADADRHEGGEPAEAPGAAEDLERRELIVDEAHENAADFERLVEMSSEWPEENVFEGARVSSNRIDEASDRQHDAVANVTSRPQSLQDYLLEQFGFFGLGPELREFGEYLIQNLDGDGRLPSSLPEIVEVYGAPIGTAAAAASRAGAPTEAVREASLQAAREVLGLVQRLDPPGVGARDFRECLLLQVRPEMPHRDVLVTLISSHLEQVAANRLPEIQRRTGVPIETLKEAIEQLRTLDPHPGRGFQERIVQNVTADLSVERDPESGQYVVKLIDEYVPHLRISRYYLEQLKGNPDPQTKEYIRRKVDSAKWLIEAIEQRYGTVKRVAQAIVDRQTGFLDEGPEHVVPLKMQQIADTVGVHVTTVSRAVDDKWIQTPRGLFPLKKFFSGGTTTADGEEMAWDIVRIKLQEIVGGEDKQNPLSDDDLVIELQKRGITVARRTVTKYRKALDIPSSRQRREY